MTDDHFTSLDNMLAEAKNAWTAERKALEDRIFALETELALIKSLHEKAVEARATAERIATKFVTQFAVVGHVFEEARSMALQMGHDIEGEAEKARAEAQAALTAPTVKTEQSDAEPAAPSEGGAPQPGEIESVLGEQLSPNH